MVLLMSYLSVTFLALISVNGFECNRKDLELTFPINFDRMQPYEYTMNLCNGYVDGSVIKQIINPKGRISVSCGDLQNLRIQERSQYKLVLFTVADSKKDNWLCIRRSTIEIECSQTTLAISAHEKENEKCHYVFKIQSPIACPVSV